MNVGIVTTWFERGANLYVSRQYLGQSEWDRDFVTWGKVNKILLWSNWNRKKDFIDWLKNRQIDVVLFNEQNWWIQ